MDRRQFLHRSVATALAVSGAALLQGCGGGHTDRLPIAVAYFPTLSFANHEKLDALIDQAVTTGVVPPELDAIAQGVSRILTPAQLAYVLGLGLQSARTLEETQRLAEAFIKTLTKGERDSLVFVAPDVFSGDLDRIQAAFAALPDMGGLTVQGPRLIVTVYSDYSVTEQVEAAGANSNGSRPATLSHSTPAPLQGQGLCFDQPTYDRLAEAADRQLALALSLAAAGLAYCVWRASQFLFPALVNAMIAVCVTLSIVGIALAALNYANALAEARNRSYKACHDQGGGG